MARIISACPDKNGVARNVQLFVGSSNGPKTVLDRPIQNTVRFPNEKTRKNQDDIIT